MLTLAKTPFNIPQGSLIKVRISAKNSIGFSIPSTLNTVGVLQSNIPHKPLTVP